jgi:prepilin-type N-terminal cleavage/methylation domain-containing protein
MKSPKKEAGFTLMEILIAIAILAFGLLAIATMQAWSIKGNSGFRASGNCYHAGLVNQGQFAGHWHY